MTKKENSRNHGFRTAVATSIEETPQRSSFNTVGPYDLPFKEGSAFDWATKIVTSKSGIRGPH